MSYNDREMKLLASQKPKVVDKLDTMIGIRMAARQKQAIMLTSEQMRALIVCEQCRQTDGSKVA